MFEAILKLLAASNSAIISAHNKKYFLCAQGELVKIRRLDQTRSQTCSDLVSLFIYLEIKVNDNTLEPMVKALIYKILMYIKGTYRLGTNGDQAFTEAIAPAATRYPLIREELAKIQKHPA